VAKNEKRFIFYKKYMKGNKVLQFEKNIFQKMDL